MNFDVSQKQTIPNAMKTYKQITTGYNLEHRWQPRLPIAPENPEPMLEASTFRYLKSTSMPAFANKKTNTKPPQK
jgi:hypothetical protein